MNDAPFLKPDETGLVPSKVLLDSFKEKPIPEKPSITINLERGDKEDTIWLTECVDPVFDMQLIVEALSTAIITAANYSGATVKDILRDVVRGLTQGTQHHGKIRRQKE